MKWDIHILRKKKMGDDRVNGLSWELHSIERKERKVGGISYLPTPWLFDHENRPDDRDDYCLGCTFLP